MRLNRTATGTSAWRDLILIVAATIAVAFASVHFELSEAVLGWARRWERYQIDELPGIALFVAVALAWFAARRMLDAQRELRRRIALEREIADALAENRRLSLSHVRAQEEERKNLARELHDELGQHLNAIKLDAVSIRDSEGGRIAEVLRDATSIVGIADHVHGVLRDISRRLRPVGLDELGLSAAIENCVDGWRARFPEIRIDVAIDGDFDTLCEALNITLYRLTQEGLINVTKHARARRVFLRLVREGGAAEGGGEVTFTLGDDGIGANLLRETRGLGLVGMRERVEALEGHMEVASKPGQGFRVIVRLPVGQGAV